MVRRRKNLLGVRMLQGLLLVVLMGGIVTVGNSYIVSQQKMEKLENNRKEIDTLSADIKNLRKDIDNSDSYEFTEQVARDEFGMVKPLEVLFIDKNKEESRE